MTKSLNNLIFAIDNLDELRDASHAINVRYKELISRTSHSFRIGEQVTFYSNKRGQIRGRVQKINQKTVKVMADNGVLWTVTSTLLKKV